MEMALESAGTQQMSSGQGIQPRACTKALPQHGKIDQLESITWHTVLPAT